MFVGNDYLIAWILYFLAVSVTAYVYYRLTPWLPRHVRVFTMLFFVSIFVAPAPVIPDQEWFAPALILVPFEILSGSKGVELQHLFDPLMNIQILTVILFLIYWLLQRYLFKQPSQQAESTEIAEIENDQSIVSEPSEPQSLT